MKLFYIIIITILIFLFFSIIYYSTLVDSLSKDELKKESFTNTKDIEGPPPSLDNSKIPKNIIQVWKTWSPKSYTQFSPNIDKLKALNPDYNYMFFKDKDLDDFLQTNYPDYYTVYNELPLNIQKVDFFRYVALYHFGGFYFDLDIKSLAPLGNDLLYHDSVFPVDEVINPQVSAQARFQKFYKNGIHQILGQYAFACSPKNDFVKKIIDTIRSNLDNIKRQVKFSGKSHDFVFKTTGPDFITNVYMDYPDKTDIFILKDARQRFGKYAIHNCVGTWK